MRSQGMLLKVIYLILAIALSISAYRVFATDRGDPWPGPVYSGNGIKFGNSFLSIDGSVNTFEITHGIDSSSLNLEIPNCGGLSVRGSSSPISGVIPGDLQEIKPGFFMEDETGAFVLVREQFFGRRKHFSSTRYILSSSDINCAKDWFLESTSIVSVKANVDEGMRLNTIINN